LQTFLTGGPKISAAAAEERMANPAAAVAAAAATAAAREAAKAAAVARISGWVEEALAALPGAAAAWADAVNKEVQFRSPIGASDKAYGVVLEAVAASSPAARAMVDRKNVKCVDMRAAVVGWCKNKGSIPAAVRAAGLWG
jgi:hypothetical protein